MFTESELEPGNLCWPLPSPPANVMFPFSLHLDSDREPPPPPVGGKAAVCCGLMSPRHFPVLPSFRDCSSLEDSPNKCGLLKCSAVLGKQPLLPNA